MRSVYVGRLVGNIGENVHIKMLIRLIAVSFPLKWEREIWSCSRWENVDEDDGDSDGDDMPDQDFRWFPFLPAIDATKLFFVEI